MKQPIFDCINRIQLLPHTIKDRLMYNLFNLTKVGDNDIHFKCNGERPFERFLITLNRIQFFLPPTVCLTEGNKTIRFRMTYGWTLTPFIVSQ